jgi:hypothetical protein
MAPRWIGAAAVAALVALAVPATAPAVTPAHARGPCALLKRAEIAQVFAVEVGKAKKRKPPSCAWKVGGGTAVAGGGELVTVLDRGRSAQASFDLAEQLEGGSVEEITGLGRAARYLPTLDTLFVMPTPNSLISLQSVFPAVPSATTTVPKTRQQVSATSHRDQLVALARLALARA